MLFQHGCLLNTAMLTMLHDFKGGQDLGGHLFKFSHFKDGKIRPEMWRVAAEPGKETTAADFQFVTLVY